MIVYTFSCLLFEGSLTPSIGWQVFFLRPKLLLLSPKMAKLETSGARATRARRVSAIPGKVRPAKISAHAFSARPGEAPGVATPWYLCHTKSAPVRPLRRNPPDRSLLWFPTVHSVERSSENRPSQRPPQTACRPNFNSVVRKKACRRDDLCKSTVCGRLQWTADGRDGRPRSVVS